MSPEESPWVQNYRKLLAEQAEKWAGHEFDEDGWHDDDCCRICLQTKVVVNSCRCAECCRRLIIEVDLDDAEREPRIKELGSPMKGLTNQVEGYILNSKEDLACVFLDRDTNLCSIYATRPLLCRLFDCEGEGREQLIELGIIKREE